MRTKILTVIFLLFTSNLVAGNADSSLKITQLKGDFYIYTTYNFYKAARIPANGMYLVTTAGVVMFDTPWDTTQFQPLLDSIKIRHGKDVVMSMATHFHADRTGGLEYYHQRGIKTYTTVLTDELSKKRDMKRAEFLVDRDTVFTIGQYSFQTFYPGQGHSPDNIIIWFEKEKILYGGCLVKTVDDDNLGNLGDADVNAYAATVDNVRKKCRKPKFVIPGHGDWSNTRSLKHTYQMAKRLARNGN